MPLIDFEILRPGVSGNRPASGPLRLIPTARRVEGETVVLPMEEKATLVAGKAQVELAPTGPDWCWRVIEPGHHVRHVLVPDEPGPIPYTSLEEVDPESLEPTAYPEPSWWKALRDLQEELSGVDPALVAQLVTQYLEENPFDGVSPEDLSNAIAEIPAPAWPVLGTPSAFPPTEHQHVLDDIVDYVAPDLSGLVSTTDPRLSDARQPLDHRHDASEIDNLPEPDLSDVVRDDDPRLSDAREPLEHRHSASEIDDLPEPDLSGYAPVGHDHDGLYARLDDMPDDPTWDTLSGKPSEFPPGSHQHTLSDITDYSLPDLSGYAPVGHDHDDLYARLDDMPDDPEWDTLPGKPSEFPPINHGHAMSEVTGLEDALNGKQPSGNYVTGSGFSAIELYPDTDSLPTTGTEGVLYVVPSGG